MRRIWALLLALLALSACGAEGAGENVSPEEPGAVLEEPEEPDTPLAELKAVEPLSAPAMVTEGRIPAEDCRLPPSVGADPDKLWENFRNWAYSDDVTGLLAEIPEADAAFYGLPLPVSGREPSKALIRWGDSLAEFDWTLFPGPSMVLPQIEVLAADSGAEKLAVICQVGAGTGVSIQELHILEKGPDGTLTAYTFPERLWQEELPRLFRAAELDGRTFAMLGYELVEFHHEGPDLDLEKTSSGMIADFSTEDWGGLRFRGAFCLSPPDSAMPCYVAETSAEILYRDGVFAMQDFHLYSYDQ